MKSEHQKDLPWLCDKCKKELEYRKVKVRYLGGHFEVELMKCPQCNMVFIEEDLALGKMLEVEKGLEDK
ncbi:DVU_1557 family redox protein [Petroclostridium sp. X23]|jgi:Zn-finger nucleic acid-binding protein|uniref:DVU_1557 family redox protein n=1 Tax=Petroclostridium sp. X23 TaxID=3045146 RepID=UPI0024AE8025|nr:CLJU_RS11820 family redox protein [Petroclostridium sp. X23]WHH58649.1 DNA-binding protein [Petroclostridium sp. X23]